MRHLETIAVGVGATLCIDAWALVLRTLFGVRSLDYCLLGRWALHVPDGTIVHTHIAASPAKPAECAVGWTTHYAIGVVFALLFVETASAGWLDRPTPLAPLAFGIATVIVPFLTVQPAFGFGVAGSRLANPTVARLKSVATHAVYGLGLYLSALLLRTI